MLTFRHLLLRSADPAAQGQPVSHTPDTFFPAAGRTVHLCLQPSVPGAGTADVHAGERRESTNLKLPG